MQNATQEPEVPHDGRVGKRVGEHLYAHISSFAKLSPDQQSKIMQASEIARLALGDHFNVVKLHKQGDECSLLSYPSCFDEPFPPLTRSWRVSLERKTVVFRTYEESRNPPILHRKELLLPADDPRIPTFSSITASAEAIGLFDEPNRIGFREYWYKLIAERGYELVGNEFVPLANAAPPQAESSPAPGNGIQRHLTALSRYNFSAPVQALSRHGLVRPELTFFDYGCGRGDDIRSLLAIDTYKSNVLCPECK